MDFERTNNNYTFQSEAFTDNNEVLFSGGVGSPSTVEAHLVSLEENGNLQLSNNMIVSV